MNRDKNLIFTTRDQDVTLGLDSKPIETIRKLLDPNKIFFENSKIDGAEILNCRLDECLARLRNPGVKAEIVGIFSELLTPLLDSYFGDTPLNDIRVSPQVKYAWSEIDLKSDNRLDQNYANSHFPTRPHQDLINNGLISSHTLVFYMQLSIHPGDENRMEVGTPLIGKQFILESTDKLGYPNELTAKSVESLTWSAPEYERGLYVFTAMKPHRSGSVSRRPRIALNVKIQPRSLSYINNIYHTDCELDSIDAIEGALLTSAEINPALFHELAALKVLEGDFSSAKGYLKKLFNNTYSDFQLNQFLYGLKTRTIYSRTPPVATPLPLIPLDEMPVTPNSCVDSILRTIHSSDGGGSA